MMQPSLSGKPSLIFLHIPKTGGTSLTHSLRAHFPESRCFTDNGNISAALLHHNAAALTGSCLFHGHPYHNTINLFGKARLATVLRRPEDHAISNYQYLQRDPGVPLHHAALACDFPKFLRHHWQFLVFQAISLDVGQSSIPVHCPEDFFRRLPRIHALLERIDFAGCPDKLDDALRVLAAAYDWPDPAPAPRLNTAEMHGVDILLSGPGAWRGSRFGCDNWGAAANRAVLDDRAVESPYARPLSIDSRIRSAVRATPSFALSWLHVLATVL